MALLAIKPSSHIVSMVFSLYSWNPDLLWRVLTRSLHRLLIWNHIIDGMNSEAPMMNALRCTSASFHPNFSQDFILQPPLLIPVVVLLMLLIVNTPSENWFQKNPHRHNDICLRWCMQYGFRYGILRCTFTHYWHKMMINHRDIVSTNFVKQRHYIAKHQEAVS